MDGYSRNKFLFIMSGLFDHSYVQQVVNFVLNNMLVLKGTLEEGNAIEIFFGTTPLSAGMWLLTLDNPS